jgi:stress-induced morphogen
MNPTDVETTLAAAIPDAEVTVERTRGDHDDDHLAVTVVSSAFAGETLVARHQRVHDALEDHLTTDIHAIELETYAPRERE